MKNRSRLISVACISACSVLYTNHVAKGATTIFNGVAALDPNAPTSASNNGNGYITIHDASSNVTGVSDFATFNTVMTNAFASNTGAVLNFGDADANGVSTFVSGVGAGVSTATSLASAFVVNYGASLANQFSFYRSDSNGSLDYNNGVAGQSNSPYTASGAQNGGYLGIQGTSSFSLTFAEPLSYFAITMLPRGAARTNTITVHYTNEVLSSSTEQIYNGGQSNSSQGVFFGFAANSSSGAITSIDDSNNGAVRFDDLAFVVAPPAVASAAVYWTNSVGNNAWSSNNWSNNANGSDSAVSLPTNGSTGVTFTASSLASGAINTTLGANQNVSSLVVNTSAASVTIGGTNSLTIGSGGINLATATPLTINTSGTVNLSNNQVWNSGSGTLTVSSNITGASGAGITFQGSSTGTAILSGSNSYSGLTFIGGGTLQLGSISALGGASATVQTGSGGILDLKNFNITVSSLTGVGGVVTTSSAATTTLTIANTTTTTSYTGSIQNGSGVVALVINSGGFLALGNSTATQNYSGGTTVNSGGSLNIGVGSSSLALVSDNTVGTGSVTIGGSTTPTANVTFQTQSTQTGPTVHDFVNNFSILGNSLIKNAEGVNTLVSPVSINGSNNTYEVALANQPLVISGGLSGSGSLTLVGYNRLLDGSAGGGYISIGNATTPVDNTAYTGTITANNTVTTDNTKGVQIVALQNAVLPNGTFAFTGDLPVLQQGVGGFNGSAISFGAGVTAPQIGALSSSTGGKIGLVSQASEPVNLILGMNTSTGSSYAGSLYDGGSGTAGSLTKVGTNQQILTGSNSYVGGTNVAGGTLTFSAPSAFPNFTNLTIGANASAGAANFGAGPKNTLFTSGLSIAGTTGAWTGKLDLANNDMVVQSGSLLNLNSQVAQGFNNGKWNGSGGIVSTAAASDTSHLHALGVILNSATGAPGGTELYSASSATPNAFDGATADASTDVLIKYTYYGDTNLDGKVDGSDYSRIDAGYMADKAVAGSATGWFNGDFNYDGVINGSDYTLIDNAFNQQGLVISSELATPTAEIAGAASVPEPTTLGLMGIGVLSVLSRRKRVSRQ